MSVVDLVDVRHGSVDHACGCSPWAMDPNGGKARAARLTGNEPDYACRLLCGIVARGEVTPGNRPGTPDSKE